MKRKKKQTEQAAPTPPPELIREPVHRFKVVVQHTRVRCPYCVSARVLVKKTEHISDALIDRTCMCRLCGGWFHTHESV